MELSSRGTILQSRKLLERKAMVAKTTRTLFLCFALTSLGSAIASAQNALLPSGKLPEFEVATVKPALKSRPAELNGVHISRDGRLVIDAYSLKNLVMLAFRLGPWQISGGDAWVGKTLYDIEAKPLETSPQKQWNLRHSAYQIEDDLLCQMLQALLIDRFQLKFHSESKTGTVFLLEKSGKNILLVSTKAVETTQPSSSASASGFIEGSGDDWVISNASITQLATYTSMVLQHPVIDRTEVTGAFDYRSPRLQSGTNATDDFAGSLVNLLHEIGFKLEQSKGPIVTFVIDHAAEPSPN
jgi:uncharacterized protein (TIGR03435 family)